MAFSFGSYSSPTKNIVIDVSENEESSVLNLNSSANKMRNSRSRYIEKQFSSPAEKNIDIIVQNLKEIDSFVQSNPKALREIATCNQNLQKLNQSSDIRFSLEKQKAQRCWNSSSKLPKAQFAQTTHINSFNVNEKYLTQKKVIPNIRDLDVHSIEIKCAKKHNKLKTQPSNYSQKYLTETKNNLTLNRLRRNLNHIKHLQNERRKSVQRFFEHSNSSKKKGLYCTLYQRSQQKKVNDSPPRKQSESLHSKQQRIRTSQVLQIVSTQKIASKKIKLKKQNQKTNADQTFSAWLSKDSKVMSDLKKNPKEVIRTNTQFKDRQSIKKQEQPPKKSHKKAERSQSAQKDFDSEFRSINLSMNSSLIQTQNINSSSTMSQRVESNLQKLHKHYRFIFSYMNQLEIIGLLNGYEIGQKKECTWCLLAIDEAYQRIKHSQETKLKGIEHSREFTYGCESGNFRHHTESV